MVEYDNANIYRIGYVCIRVPGDVSRCDCMFLLQEPREELRSWSGRADSRTCPVGDVHIVIEKIFKPVSDVWGTTPVYIGR